MSKRGVKRNEAVTTSAEFGKYMIHLPSLDSNILRVTYPKSKAPVASLNNYMLSPELATLLKQLVERGVVSESQLEKLSKSESTLLRKICKVCQIDKSVLLPDDEQEKEDLKRFELLRGELISGNDNMDILKEIKQYIIKFAASGVIPRAKATELLLHITCVELGQGR